MKKSNKTWSFLLICLGTLFNYSYGQSYCASSSTTCENEIQQVNLTGVNSNINKSSSCTPGGYADYTSLVAYVNPGGTYSGSTTSNPQLYPFGNIVIYVDWNQDGAFGNPGEVVFSSNTSQGFSGQPLPFSMSVPNNAVLGTTRMRVKTSTAAPYAGSCGNVTVGETEDYTIIVTNQPVVATSYCAANGGCDGGASSRHIANVTYGSVNNTSTCGSGSYSDFTNLTSDLAAGSPLNVIVSSDLYNPADLVNVFVDWNNDFDFNDAGENNSFVGNGGVYTGTINAPANAVPGPRRMRIAFYSAGYGVYNGCGSTPLGEIEDYTVTVTAPAPNCIINNAPADGSTDLCRDLTLTWNRDLLGSQPEGYKVYFGSATSLAMVSDQDTTSYDLTGLLPNTTYYYSIVAYNSTGDATGCDTFSFTTTDLATAISPNPAVVCAGATITLNGNATGSGNNYASQVWSGTGATNLSSTTTDATDFTSASAGDYDLTYTVTDNNGCQASEDITVSVQNTSMVDVTIAITNGTNPACDGANVEFTATGTNEGLTPVFTWRINGIDVGNGSTFSSTTLMDGDVVDVVLNSSLACVDDPAKVSNAIIVTINPSVIPTLQVASTMNPYCAGDVVNLSTAVTNEGANPTYEWLVNGISVATGPTFSNQFQDGDTVVCVLTSDAFCAVPAIVNDSFFVAYTSYETPSVELTITQGTNPSCAGDPLEFTALPTFGGTNPMYEWFVNGNQVAQGDVYSTSFSNGDLISVTMTSSYACLNQPSGNSGDSVIQINPVVTPSIQIASSQSIYCEGTQVTILSQVTNEGSAPVYEWRVNGSAMGANDSYTQVFQSGDKVVCELMSDVACATQSSVISDTLFMFPTANQDPMVDFTITQGANPDCDGSTMELTASPTYGGQNPNYEWFLNGNSVATGGIYSGIFSNGDLIAVELTSDYECLNQTTANSGDSMIIRISNETPTVEAYIFDGNDTICAGTPVTFATNETFTGNNPVYEWTVNGAPISANPTYTTAALMDGDVLQVNVVSDYDCVTDPNASSQTITMVVKAVPAQPSISVDVDVLTSSADFNNQWQYNGNDISGAVNKTYIFTQNGDYTVYVIENGCSSDTSDVFTANNAGIVEMDESSNLEVFPNPTSGVFNLRIEQPTGAQVTIQDMNGKVMKTIEVKSTETMVDISSLQNGVYLIAVQTEQKSLVVRLVKK